MRMGRIEKVIETKCGKITVWNMGDYWRVTGCGWQKTGTREEMLAEADKMAESANRAKPLSEALREFDSVEIVRRPGGNWGNEAESSYR